MAVPRAPDQQTPSCRRNLGGNADAGRSRRASRSVASCGTASRCSSKAGRAQALRERRRFAHRPAVRTHFVSSNRPRHEASIVNRSSRRAHAAFALSGRHTSSTFNVLRVAAPSVTVVRSARCRVGRCALTRAGVCRCETRCQQGVRGHHRDDARDHRCVRCPCLFRRARRNATGRVGIRDVR